MTGVEISGIFSRSRQKDRVAARSLFCYWASRELGIAHTELARRLEISLPAISYAVERGERIAKEKPYRLFDE
ncbi:MAG: hypothetical protein STSR0002_28860 [Smithella sp.]